MIPRPKILTAFTVPAAGWQLKFYLSTAGNYDTAVTATVAGGDYFVAWDQQSDDFLKALAAAMEASIKALGAPWNVDDTVGIWLNSSHQSIVGFDHDLFNNATRKVVKIAWTELDGPTIAKVLGFDPAADDTSTSATNPTFTSDYQHAYGWYADEDGQLETLDIYDADVVKVLQSVADSGVVRSQLIASRRTNKLVLNWLTRERALSDGVGYTEAPRYPMAYNVPLECWWREARRGRRFRLYIDAADTTSRATDAALLNTGACTATNVAISGKTYSTEPSQFTGGHVILPRWGKNITTMPGRAYISAQASSSAFTVAAHALGYAWGLNDTTDRIYLFDGGYQTYVLDLGATHEWRPEDPQNIDRYRVELALLRYTS